MRFVLTLVALAEVYSCRQEVCGELHDHTVSDQVSQDGRALLQQAKSLSGFTTDAGLQAGSSSDDTTDDEAAETRLSDELYTYGGGFLQERLVAMVSSAFPALDELDRLVKDFVERQAASQDECPALLMEAKHNLNTLRANVHDLSLKVNTTEMSLQADSRELAQLQDELTDMSMWCLNETEKCKQQKTDYTHLWLILKSELAEMHNIAQPGVTMPSFPAAPRAAARLLQVLSSTSRVELRDVGEALNQNQTTDVDGVEKLLRIARSLADDYHQRCLSSEKKLPPPPDLVSFLEESSVASPLVELSCAADLKVEVTVGNRSRTVFPGRFLASGEQGSVSCGNVDTDYVGILYITCTNGTLTPDSSNCISSAEEGSDDECKKRKAELELAYAKAYVEVTRLVEDYEQLANSSACLDATKERCDEYRGPRQERVAVLSKNVEDRTETFVTHRGKLKDAVNSEARLRDHVELLTKNCVTMDATVSSLDKVRDVIEALHLCPGMMRPEFYIPLYHNYEETTFLYELTDDVLDSQLTALCANAARFNGRRQRAAEVSEIAQRTIEGVPMNNPAPVPLLGTCPNCDGRADQTVGPSHPSGHFRICWNPGAALSVEGQRGDCDARGHKAVLCVIDRSNFAGLGGNTSVTSVVSKKAECTNKPPPSGWIQNTCVMQKAAGNCEQPWFRDHPEGYCHETCGYCTP